MKTSRWPFLPTLAAGLLILLMTAVKINHGTSAGKTQCAGNGGFCNVPAVSFNRLVP